MLNQGVSLKPVITERAFAKANQGWYTFAVGRNLNKNQARKLIEEVFGVKVEKIKSAICKGKSRRSLRTRREIKGSDFKKIVVRLAKDQKIDIFEAGGK